jgi:ABC-2 type transport system ATP-binding protein
MTDLAIEVTGLRKSYGDNVVLDGIDLSVSTGSLVALLGPNGAGKTTTVQILSTLIDADDGLVLVAGHDVRRARSAVRRIIGVTGQFAAVDNLLTGAENLQLMADLRHLPKAQGRQRVADLLTQFDLAEAADKPASVYSGGMRRRLDLAMSLVTEPSIIFLDEPTTGLDPRSRRVLWDMIRGLLNRGVTILLTTQYLEEADQLADRVVLLDGGKIVADGTPQALKQQVSGAHVRLQFGDAANFAAASSVLPLAARNVDDLVLAVPSDGDVRSLKSVLDVLERADVTVEDLSIQMPTLDDVFLSLTGRPSSTPQTFTQSKETAR